MSETQESDNSIMQAGSGEQVPQSDPDDIVRLFGDGTASLVEDDESV